MEQIKFENNVMLNKKDIEKTKSKVIDELLSKPFIKEKVKKLNIDMKKFNDYLGYFLSYAEDYEMCKNCKELKTCKKEIKGIKMDLVIDEYGYLSREYKLCEYQEEERKIKQNYLIKDFPDEYNHISLDRLDGRIGRIELETALCSIEIGQTKQGIYAYGNPNTGKSFPFIALCNSFVKNGVKCAFVDVKNFIESLKSTFNNSSGDYNELMDRVKNVEVLVLDGFGEEKASEWVRDDVLSTILDHRYKNKLLTFITSSYSLDEIKELYYDVSKSKTNTNRLKTDRFIEKILQNCPGEPIRVSDE